MRDDYYNDLGNLLNYTKRRQWQWQVFLDVTTFTITGLVAFYVINYSAINVRLDYVFAKRDNTPTVSSATSTTTATTQTTQNHIGNSDPSGIASPIINIPSDIPASGIYIAKIDTKAPIAWNGTSDNTQELLKQGVVHIEGSALPGTPGNVFLTGHSSDLPWSDGNYKTVFALLDKLENGDDIIIKNNNTFFTYKVYNKQVVKKDEVGNFVATDKEQTLTIMTCYPVGSSWKRLIVQAQRQGE